MDSRLRGNDKEKEKTKIRVKDTRMKTGQKQIVALLLGVLLAGVLAGCLSNNPTTGYTAKSQYRQGIRTVAVPIWTRGKDIYRRDIEIRLTESLVKRIELDTPYKVTTKQRADTILTGNLHRLVQMGRPADGQDNRQTAELRRRWDIPAARTVQRRLLPRQRRPAGQTSPANSRNHGIRLVGRGFRIQ